MLCVAAPQINIRVNSVRYLSKIYFSPQNLRRDNEHFVLNALILTDATWRAPSLSAQVNGKCFELIKKIEMKKKKKNCITVCSTYTNTYTMYVLILY